MKENGKIKNDTYVICNGFKRDQYIDNITNLINGGHENCIPIIDNYEEINLLTENIKGDFKIGIRIASEEEPKFEFYTSRLGIGYKNIVPFYEDQIKNNERLARIGIRDKHDLRYALRELFYLESLTAILRTFFITS